MYIQYKKIEINLHSLETRDIRIEVNIFCRILRILRWSEGSFTLGDFRLAGPRRAAPRRVSLSRRALAVDVSRVSSCDRVRC